MIQLKRLHHKAIIPTRAHADDAGLDLYIMDDIVLLPGAISDLEIGWAMKMPDGYWGLVKARSSTFFKRGLIVHEGTIDPGYTGGISIGVYNPSIYSVLLQTGDRIAQLVILPLITPDILIIEKLPATLRGDKGFGSTGPGR